MRSRGLLTLALVAGGCLSGAPLLAQDAPSPAPAPPTTSRPRARPPRPPQDSVLVYMLDSAKVRYDSVRRSYFFGDSLRSMMVQAFTVRRVRLGVVVNTQPSESDSLGAKLDAVTPGGPAALAGLQAGDVITRFGKTPLGVQLAKVPAGTRVSSPGLKLVELVAKLAPNDTVSIEYRRGTAKKTTRVVTAMEPEMVLDQVVGPEAVFGAMPGSEDYWVGIPDAGRERAAELALRRSELARGVQDQERVLQSYYMRGPLLDIELAPVNPQLGSYFGTTEGVLIVDAPQKAPLGLLAGDVILNVDGRAISSPRQLMRVLGSYDMGEPIQVEVMRQKKRVTLKGTLGR